MHFFSGYRRKGDIHEILEHRQVATGVEIFVLSVDMCIQREQGNLIAPMAHRFWARCIASGQIVGAGGGPPCETFSAARHQGNGPKPLRSSEFPWGMPNLRPCEWKQVMVGTRLLQFIFDMLLLLAQTGGCGFCEHPQYPVWLLSKQPSSIWSQPAVRALRLLHCFGVTSFDQCEFGADATKPTTILHLRLPALRRRLMRGSTAGRCSHGAGAHQRLSGRQEDGAFRTSKCKIYPQGLNRAIADAVFDQLCAVYAGCHIGHGLPADLLPFACSDFVDTNLVQPDFHGAAVQR